jgi:hypothetical protein
MLNRPTAPPRESKKPIDPPCFKPVKNEIYPANGHAMIFSFSPLNMIRQLAFVINLAALALLLPVKQTESATLDAHEHGSAILNIAADGNILLFEFESPAANIVGFEHEPRTTSETAAIEAAINLLGNFEQVFHLSGSAGCKLDGASVKQATESGGHSEFHAEYQLICGRIERLESIDVLLFDRFADIKDIDVQAIFPGNQIAMELSPAQPVIKLK